MVVGMGLRGFTYIRFGVRMDMLAVEYLFYGIPF